MNKILIVMIAVVVLAGVVLFSQSRSTDGQSLVTVSESTETESEAHMDDTMADHESTDGVSSAPMVIPGADGAAALDTAVELTVDAFSFGYSESEIRVTEGDTVTINLTNSGGFHDWVVDEFNAATSKIREGETTSVTFVADKAGTYEYYCSVGNHRAQGMVGTLIVE